MAANHANPPISPLAMRVVALAFLLVGAHMWVVGHRGFDVTKFVVLEAAIVAFSLIAKVGTRRQAKAVQGALENVGLFLLGPVFLMSLAIALVVVGSLFSTVIVFSGGQSAATVKLGTEASGSKVAEDRVDEAEPVARFTRMTSPFGRSFFVEVDGFERYSFELYPWVPRRVRMAHDLTALPTVLVRVPVANQSQLDGGRLHLLQSGSELASAATSAESAAMLVGRERSVPGELLQRWDRQLRAVMTDEATRNRAIAAWENAQKVATPTPPRRRRALVAEFRTENRVTARKEFMVESEPFQDVLLVTMRPQ